MRPLLLFLFAGCSSPPATCPGLPDTLPSSWGAIPDGLDTNAFDKEVESLMRTGCIPALSVSVVNKKGLVLSAAWGWANVEDQIPATVNTPFMAASTSKAVDAIALLIAEERGLLSREDPVSDLVGFEVKNARLRNGPTIKLKHLLTHSSGIADNWNQELDASYAPGDPTEPLGAFMEGYFTKGGEHYHRHGNFFLWPAGREWMYSNVGAALAAYSVEVQSGVPYQDFSKNKVLSPLQMDHSGWFLADFDDTTLIARPHVIEEGRWVVKEHYGYPTWPDGQLRTTATDLGQILRLKLNDGVVDGVRLLKPGAVDSLSTVQVSGLSDWYLGKNIEAQYFLWFGMSLGDRWIIGHDGDDLGVTCEMFYEPKTEVGVALLGNVGDWLLGSTTREQTMALQHKLYAIGENAK